MHKLVAHARSFYKSNPFIVWLTIGNIAIWKLHSSWMSTALFGVAYTCTVLVTIYAIRRLHGRVLLRHYRRRYSDNPSGFPYPQFAGLLKHKPTAPAYEVIGFRFARLQLVDGAPKFIPMYGFTPFSVRAEATCRSNMYEPMEGDEQPHNAPDPDCTCGFYSQKSLQLLTSNLDMAEDLTVVLLMCSYTGTVIPGTTGQRAQTQHVLKVWVPNVCALSGCSDSSFGMAPISGLLPMIPGMSPFFGDGLIPLCQHHSHLSRRLFSLVDLRQYLPTEFTFSAE